MNNRIQELNNLIHKYSIFNNKKINKFNRLQFYSKNNRSFLNKLID